MLQSLCIELFQTSFVQEWKKGNHFSPRGKVEAGEQAARPPDKQGSPSGHFLAGGKEIMCSPVIYSLMSICFLQAQGQEGQHREHVLVHSQGRSSVLLRAVAQCLAHGIQPSPGDWCLLRDTT